jgi:autotransporter-associated beta strand protein
MKPQSFAKSPGHFLAKQTARLLCCCALLVVWLTASPVAHAGTIWDGGGGATTNIDTAANWDGDALPVTLTDGTQTLTFGTGGSTATINTNVNALGLVINRDAAFTIANGAGNLTIGNGGITVNPGSTTARAHVISESNLILAGNQTWAVTNTGVGSGNMQLTVSSGISGNFGIIKNGTGVLALSGANTYDGATTVSSGAALQLQGGITIGAEALSLAGTGNGSDGTGALRNISSSNTYGGAITLAGATRINSDAGLLTLSGGISGNTQNLTIGGAGNTTVSNAIATTTGTLTKDGAGTLVLSGANSYTGNTEYSGNPGGGLDQVVIGNATTTALSTSQLQQIHFYSGIEQSSFIANAFQITSGTYNREIIAVPEPETYITAVALLLGVTFYQIRLARHGQGLLARLTFLRRRAKRKPLGGSSSRMTQISSTEGL